MTQVDEFGFEFTGDPTKIEKNYSEPFPMGDTKVFKIAKWIKVDGERSLPIFVPMGNEMKCMFEWAVPVDELLRLEGVLGRKVDRGPVMSATYAEMVALVDAFGGNITLLPKGETSAFLMTVQALLEENTTARVCRVNKDGWVQYVEGANPPSVIYCWKYAGSRSADSPASVPVRFVTVPQKGRNGTEYDATFVWSSYVIVGDDWGNPSPYNGYSIDVKMNNPFDDPGLTRPRFKLGAQGGKPIDVERFENFVSVFCPQVYSHSWQSDPEKSGYGVDELDNPFVVIDDLARKSGVVVKGLLEFSAGGKPKIDPSKFRASQAPIDVDAQQAKAMQQSSALEELYTLIEDVLSPDFRVFESTDPNADEINFTFTAQGKKWAKEVLVPAWTVLKLPVENGFRFIKKLNDDQLTALTNYLMPQLEEEIPFEVDEEEGF